MKGTIIFVSVNRSRKMATSKLFDKNVYERGILLLILVVLHLGLTFWMCEFMLCLLVIDSGRVC